MHSGLNLGGMFGLTWKTIVSSWTMPAGSVKRAQMSKRHDVGMEHEELFTARHREYRITIMETPDGHIYPMGGRHECSNHNCPASYKDAPSTTLGSVGIIEGIWSSYTDVEPQEALEVWEDV